MIDNKPISKVMYGENEIPIVDGGDTHGFEITTNALTFTSDVTTSAAAQDVIHSACEDVGASSFITFLNNTPLENYPVTQNMCVACITGKSKKSTFPATISLLRASSSGITLSGTGNNCIIQAGTRFTRIVRSLNYEE